MLSRHWVLGLALALAVTQARADTDWISLLWHNDLLLGTDGGGYTNGLYLSWFDLSYTKPEEFSPPWLTRPFLGWLIDHNGQHFEVSAHTVGQAMITPKNISRAVPEPSDAPYAGLLFWRSRYTVVHGRRADSLAITLGMVGPSSGAEDAQTFIHRIVGSTRPEGWDYQVRDEPVGQIERASVWRFGPEVGGTEASYDLLALGRVYAGNLEGGAGAAFIVRYGTRLERSFATASNMVGRISNPMTIDGGWNLYMGVGADYVYNQILIGGSGIRSGPGAELRHDQYLLFGGWSRSWRRLSMTISLAANTNLDKQGSARHRFGAVTLAWNL